MIQSAITGLIPGGAYALIGVCIVIMYRMVRIVNFAQAAIGAFGAYVAILLSEHGWAYGPAFVMAAITGAALAAVCGLIMAIWFAGAEVDRRSVVAVALFISILTLGLRAFGDHPHKIPALLPSSTIKVAGVVISWASILIVLAAIALAWAIQVFLKRYRLGLRLRAMSERPKAAELLGVPARRLAVGVWAFTGAISAAGVLVVAPTRAADFSSMGLLVLPALAAAAIGLFRSTWAAVAGGIGIGLIEGLSSRWGSISPYQDAVPLIVIVAVLVWSQRREVWDAAR